MQHYLWAETRSFKNHLMIKQNNNIFLSIDVLQRNASQWSVHIDLTGTWDPSSI